MRRLSRWCFNGLCLLSLLAFLGAAWMWWRGARGGAALELTEVEIAVPGINLKVSSGLGLSAKVTGRWPGPYGVWEGEGLDVIFHEPLGRERVTRDLSVAGLQLEIGEWRPGIDLDGYPPGPPAPYYQLSITPRWLAQGLLACPLLLWLATGTRRRLALRRRRRLGLCPRCGYDLTGNTSGRCSECGTAIESAGRVTA